LSLLLNNQREKNKLISPELAFKQLKRNKRLNLLSLLLSKLSKRK
jgi:hypothetical protein